MLTEAELLQRKSFFFRGQGFFTFHKMVTITEYDMAHRITKATKIMVGWLLSSQGFKHAFILAPSIDVDFALLLADSFPMQALREILDGVHMKWGNQTMVMDDQGSLQGAPFTNRVYIFTGTLKQNRQSVKGAFRSHGLESIIVDDERWKVEWKETPADAFICHDSRDKPRFARPLYDELIKRNLKIWLDDFAIRPGDDFVKKIDQGLATSRHALLLLTQRLLRNDRWASQEMSSLLNRQFSERRENLIVPVYIGVSPNDVLQRSPLLAKAWAVKTSALNFRSRVNKVADEICRTVGPGYQP